MRNNNSLEIEYVPPKSEHIRAFARRVCENLAAQSNNPIFINPHVIIGLAELLEIAARAEANRLNSLQSVDKAQK